jgi:SAM-dependent methyltransferase
MTNRTAKKQADLWGERARDWADLVESVATLPVYEDVLRRLEIGTGTNLLDVGCGTGVFARLAADRGADVSGLDATAAFLAIARERLPGADLREGELEELPFADASFDVVTGFNSFQYAGTPTNALAEARRVVKPGGKVVITTWGRAEDCEAAAYLAALRPFLNPPPGAPGPFALSDEKKLRELVESAGLRAGDPHDVDCVWTYRDLDHALRAMLAAGPAVAAVRAGGEPAVREAVTGAIAAFRQSDGGYRVENRFRYVIAMR